MTKISKLNNSGKQIASIWLALGLIATGAITLPYTVSADSPEELIGSDISTVCGATGSSAVFGAWTHNSGLGYGPETGLDSKWGSLSAYTSVVVS